MALPANASPINISDTIADTIKTTAGYFTNGDGTLAGTDIFTGSLSDSNQKYYFNINQSHPSSSNTETQFSVAFAHAEGSGSDTYGDSVNPNTLRGETQAIYKQLTNLLLEETEASGGFKISANGSAGINYGAQTRDEYLYIIAGKRDKFKDRINKKAWTLFLSGSHGTGGHAHLQLTDDSATTPAVATPGGPRYNIVSGSIGKVSGSGASYKTYGYFYPEMGLMLFSGVELSSSMGGITAGLVQTASFDYNQATTNYKNTCGFAPNLDNDGNNPMNALRMVNCLRSRGANTAFRLRSEEDQTQENYFCRIRAEEYNFSANPTFTSGSKNKIRAADMHGNPQTFITGLGLYNSAGQLLAIAKLSSPLKKNFASEATIKVKLTY